MDNKTKGKSLIHSEGRLLVITGNPAAGKDVIVNKLLVNNYVESLRYKRLVTYADRPRRPGEVQGVDYHFVTKGKLQQFYEKNLLVETPIKVGVKHYKATSRMEFEKIIYKGERKIWRIDPSRAAEVASGIFFDTQFSTQESSHLKKNSEVVFITADQKTLERRRKLRHGKNYKNVIKDYIQRDLYEQKVIEKHGHYFTNVIENPDGDLDRTVNKILSLIQSLHR